MRLPWSPASGARLSVTLRSGERSSVSHYPVTISWWKGIWDLRKIPYANGPIRRACDWQMVWMMNELSFNWREVTCKDCVAYIENLRRLLGKRKDRT
jgi:hypothetical protein